MAKNVLNLLSNKKYWYYVLLFLFFAIAALSIPVYQRYVSYTIINQTQQKFLHKAIQESFRVESYIDNQRLRIGELTNNAEFSALCAEVANSVEPIVLESSLGKKFTSSVNNLFVKQLKTLNVLFVNKAGIVLASSDFCPYLGKCLVNDKDDLAAIEASFMRVLMSMSPDVSDFSFDTKLKKRALFISTPIFKDLKFQGVLIVQVDTAGIYGNNAAQNNQDGDVSFVKNKDVNFVKTRNQGIVYISTQHKGKIYHWIKKIISSEQILSIISFAPSKALAAKQGAGITYDYASREKISAWNYIPKVDWGVVVENFKVIDQSFFGKFLFWICIIIALLFLFLMEKNNPIIFYWGRKFYTSLKINKMRIKELGILIIVLSVLTACLYFFYLRKIALQSAQLDNRIESTIEQLQNSTTNILNKFFREGYSLVENLSSGRLKNDDIRARLHKIIKENNFVNAVGVIYSPQIEVSSNFEYVVTSREKNGVSKLSLDIDDPWYVHAIKKLYCFSQTSILTTSKDVCYYYAMPFFAVNDNARQKALGIVLVEYSIKSILEMISAPQEGRQDFIFLASENGTFLFHPEMSLVLDKKDLLFYAQKNTFGIDLYNFFKEALDKKKDRDFTSYYDIATHQKSNVVFVRNPHTNWILGAMYSSSPEMDVYLLQRYWAGILVLGAIIVFIFLLMLFGRTEITKRLFAYASAVGLGVVFLGMIFLVNFSPKSILGRKELALRSSVHVDNFFRRQEAFAGYVHEEKPHRVPVALLVKSIVFNSAEKVFIEGNLWAHYTEHTKQFLGNFKFIDALAPPIITKDSEIVKNGITTIKWKFSVSIKQKNDVLLYPLDMRSINLKIEYADASKHVLFAPALEDYDNMHGGNAGLSQDLTIIDYDVADSFFVYKNSSDEQSTNILSENEFGNEKKILTYVIVLQHQLLNFLMTFLFPLMFLLISLLGVFVFLLRRKNTEILAGVVCGLLLLAGLAVHLLLRHKLAARGLIYIDSIAFILYFACLMIMLYAAVRRCMPKWSGIHEMADDIELYIVPVSLLAMIVVTWVIFF